MCANFRAKYSEMFSEGLEGSERCCHWHCLLGINEKTKPRGSTCSQIDPYGTLAAADRRAGVQKEIVLLRQVRETTLFPTPLIGSVLPSTMGNTGSIQRLLANKYHHLAITSWCPPPSQSKSKARLPGERNRDYSSDIQPMYVQGAQKGWRCFLKHLLTPWLTRSAMSHPENAFILLSCL